MVVTFPGGAISNLYAVAVARFKAEPRSKQQGMTSLTSRLVMFSSEHVSNDVIHPINLDTYLSGTWHLIVEPISTYRGAKSPL